MSRGFHGAGGFAISLIFWILLTAILMFPWALLWLFSKAMVRFGGKRRDRFEHWNHDL